jgi:hypothetical protein
VAYLDSLPVSELAELPGSRREPLQLGVLMVALNERLPDAYKLLPPAGQPGPREGRRRSLREVVADRRAARAADRAGPPPSGLAERRIDRRRQAEQHTDRRRAGAVGERRVAEALRARATDQDPAAGHQHHGKPPDEPPERQSKERDSQREEDFGDSWRAYRERADHIRQTYGWRVPQPSPRAENWLPLGGDDQENGEPPDRSGRWLGEERDREDR